MQADRDLSFGNFHALTPKSCRVFYVNSSSCRTRYSITQQQGQHRRVLQRLTEIRFYQPDIVGHARCGADVNQPVQQVPPPPAQAANPS